MPSPAPIIETVTVNGSLVIAEGASTIVVVTANVLWLRKKKRVINERKNMHT